MAEPQANTQTEQSRAKENASAQAARTEQRTFEEGQAIARAAGTAAGAGEIAPSAAGEQVAEAGRRAGQQMAEAWRNTLDPFMAMQFDVNRWFDEMWRQTLGFSPAPALQAMRPFRQLGAASLFGLPPADLKETKDAYLLDVELPGLTKAEVDISVQGDRLIICGHKAEETEDASAAYRVSERRFGRFERSFALPPDVDRHRIEAQFRDGVLKIGLPKDQQAAPERSKIEIGG
ncbi:MAG: Hsp20/alpha crystallin family protein [Caulobacterales bacterium]